MLNNTKKNQHNLLEILDKLFVWVKKPSELNSDNNSLETQMVTINPKLNAKSLQDLVVKTRKLIITIYLQCEEEYQEGLKIFEAIAGERILKNSINKKEQLEKQLDTMVVGKPDNNLQELVKQNIDNIIQSTSAPAAVAAGGNKSRRYKRSK